MNQKLKDFAFRAAFFLLAAIVIGLALTMTAVLAWHGNIQAIGPAFGAFSAVVFFYPIAARFELLPERWSKPMKRLDRLLNVKPESDAHSA